MEAALLTTANMLLRHPDRTHLLLEYYTTFSQKALKINHFQGLLNLLNETLRKNYPHQKIEIFLQQNPRELIRFLFDPQTGQLQSFSRQSYQDTLYNHTLEHRRIILTNNYPDICADLGVDHAGIPACSWLGIPLKIRKKILGLLVMWDRNPLHKLTIYDKYFLMTLTNIVRFAIENLYLHEYLAEQNDIGSIWKTLLNTFVNTHSAFLSVPALLDSVLKKQNIKYTALFHQQQQWQILNERYSTPLLAAVGEVISGDLSRFPYSALNGSEYLFWHCRDPHSPSEMRFKQLSEQYAIEAVLVFPVLRNKANQYMWTLVFSEQKNAPDAEELCLYRFIFYLLVQALAQQPRNSFSNNCHSLEKNNACSASSHSTRIKTMAQLDHLLQEIVTTGEKLKIGLQESAYQADITQLLNTAYRSSHTLRELDPGSIIQPPLKHSGASEVFDINQLIKKVVETFRSRQEKTIRPQHHFHLSLQELPPITGRQAEFQEALKHLFNNACEAMPEGGDLSIQTRQQANRLFIFIKDTGIGVAPELQKKIFTPFYTTKGGAAKGLGLSISAAIIKKHHGKIHIDAIPQRGSVFMIELPLKQLKSTFRPIDLDSIFGKILLLEERNSNGESLETLLESEGFEVTVTWNARDALRNYHLYHFDIVLIDFNAASARLLQTAAALKEHQPATPIFIVTGWNQLDTSLAQMNHHINGIIRRPIDIVHLKTEIASTLIQQETFYSVTDF